MTTPQYSDRLDRQRIEVLTEQRSAIRRHGDELAPVLFFQWPDVRFVQAIPLCQQILPVQPTAFGRGGLGPGSGGRDLLEHGNLLAGLSSNRRPRRPASAST